MCKFGEISLPLSHLQLWPKECKSHRHTAKSLASSTDDNCPRTEAKCTWCHFHCIGHGVFPATICSQCQETSYIPDLHHCHQDSLSCHCRQVSLECNVHFGIAIVQRPHPGMFYRFLDRLTIRWYHNQWLIERICHPDTWCASLRTRICILQLNKRFDIVIRFILLL